MECRAISSQNNNQPTNQPTIQPTNQPTNQPHRRQTFLAEMIIRCFHRLPWPWTVRVSTSNTSRLPSFKYTDDLTGRMCTTSERFVELTSRRIVSHSPTIPTTPLRSTY